VSPEHDVLEPAVIVEGGGRLKVRGEIDHGSATAFGDRVRRAVATCAGPLRLDLSEVWFLDLAGIRQLLKLVGEGHRIVLFDPSPAARLLLELPSIRQRLEVRVGEEPNSVTSPSS
jgi:anti-anti-sigma factor